MCLQLSDIYCHAMRVAAAKVALRKGVAAAHRELETVSEDFVRYWRRKNVDLTFHPGLSFSIQEAQLLNDKLFCCACSFFPS